MCIEVKTTLGNENLRDTLLKIRDLRRMNFFKRLDGNPRWQVHPPLCFIFTYDTVWKKSGSILKNITKIVKENDIKPGGKIPYNPRWPQFFPSKLINDYPIFLQENQMWQLEGFRAGLFNNLTIENQIKSIINFLSKLCQAIE